MQRASSGSPFEASIGFSRAVRVGNRILVSGTAPIEPDGSSTVGDAGVQTTRCLDVIVAAVEQLGGTVNDIVRTRVFLLDAAEAGLIGAVPDTRIRLPTRTAREKPIDASNGEPDDARCMVKRASP